MKTNLINKNLISLVIVFQILFAGNMNSQITEDRKLYFQGSYNQWTLSDSIRVYNSDNLYEYIDGAADSYISYDFEELFVATYNGTDTKYITAEIYKHKTPVNAFGIYTTERPLNGKFSKIGVQGYQEEGILNFLCDKYYVKIMSHDKAPETQVTISKIAADIAKKINPNAEMPKAMLYFPEEGKIENSETYVNSNFLGYEFLNAAYLASYGQKDHSFRLFIIESKSFDDAKQMLNSYMTNVKQTFNGMEGQYTVKDPYNGTIKLEWKGKYIWGILNEANIILNKDYLRLVEDKLK
jgi:hypothetical protein